MSKLAKLLSLPDMADRLASAGRGKDSILAHINPTEARLLKSRGGSGKRNPRTGIMEFRSDFEEDNPAASAVQPEPMKGGYGSGMNNTSEPAPAPAFDPYAGGNDRATIPAPALAPGAAPAAEQAAAPVTETTTAADIPKPGFMQTLKGYGKDLSALTQALQPAAPYLKAGVGAVTAYKGLQAAQQNQEQAGKNQAEIKALSDPYRAQAAQFQQQGQQLINLGQGGGLTSPQQKRLEVQRAQAAQQMASAGVTGGTSQQQLEANLQQQAAAFAQQNVDEGMKLVAAAQGINQTADKYIQEAINVGYTQNKDAQALAADFYRSIAQFFAPEASTNPTQQANAAPK
jgi:hypothetical protein